MLLGTALGSNFPSRHCKLCAICPAALDLNVDIKRTASWDVDTDDLNGSYTKLLQSTFNVLAQDYWSGLYVLRVKEVFRHLENLCKRVCAKHPHEDGLAVPILSELILTSTLDHPSSSISNSLSQPAGPVLIIHCSVHGIAEDFICFTDFVQLALSCGHVIWIPIRMMLKCKFPEGCSNICHRGALVEAEDPVVVRHWRLLVSPH